MASFTIFHNGNGETKCQVMVRFIARSAGQFYQAPEVAGEKRFNVVAGESTALGWLVHETHSLVFDGNLAPLVQEYFFPRPQ